jgi:ADP-ribose pyrophosphatase YjhB (NUDIX family)
MKHSERHLVRITASVVAHRNGKILLIKEGRKGKANPICEPVGHVDPGEEIVAAAEREFHEETGYLVKITGLIGICHTFFGGNGNIDSVRFAFRGRVVGGHPRLRKEKDITPFFVTRTELKRLVPKVKYASKRALQDYLAGRRVPLRTITNLEK